MTTIAIEAPTALLGGLSPAQFMRRHWQKKPLLVRQALPMRRSFIGRSELFALAARDDVEARLVRRQGRDWTLAHGPFARRALPPLARPQWSLLVQGLDLHLDMARTLLDRFRFVPDARLDDVMVSYASDQGGVGPHLDSYDVFLLQIHGRRRWRIGRVAEPTLQTGVPLKILANFRAEHDWVLEPGDMLYLPPRWAHDGVAEGECMTCSIGFRAPARDPLAHELLQRALDADADEAAGAGDAALGGPALYQDRRQAATATPACIPAALQEFGAAALQRWLAERLNTGAALGEVLSEPKPGVWFDGGAGLRDAEGVRLDRRTRMLYDARHVFINGESYRAGGRDARRMRELADRRVLSTAAVRGLSAEARELLAQWAQAGWLHAAADDVDDRNREDRR